MLLGFIVVFGLFVEGVVLWCGCVLCWGGCVLCDGRLVGCLGWGVLVVFFFWCVWCGFVCISEGSC